MACRVQLFWTTQGNLLGGWSENFWNNRPFSADIYPLAKLLFQQLDKMHGNQTYCSNIRVSDLDNFRNVQNESLTTGPSAPSDSPNASDFMNTAALLKLNATGSSSPPILYSTKQWVRSCHDGDVNSGGRWNPLPATTAALGLLRGQLTTTGNGWCCRVQDQSTPKKIVAAASAAGVITANGHGFADGQKVIISRAKGDIPINGTWRVTVIDANHFSLIGFQQPAGTPVYLGNGVTYAVNKILVPITDIKVVRATAHKTGRPFGQSSGRRRTQRT